MTIRYECSVASRERGEDLFATASNVRRWLLVEVTGPWGADKVRDTALAPHAPGRWLAGLADAGVRLVAVRRSIRSQPGAAVRIAYADCVSRRTWVRSVDDLSEVAAATARVPLEVTPDAAEGWDEVPGPVVLVCTNGRHDSCCATYGRPVLRSLRDSAWDDMVWESSHIGGDRFAANVVVLPIGLYFGRVDPDRAAELLDGVRAGRLDLDSFRGRSTLGFAAQAAEHFVRRELDLDRIDDVTGVERDRERGVFTVDLADGRSADVRLRRTLEAVPTPLTCKGPDDASAPVYRLIDLTIPDR